jgi:hypothetical protein
MLPSNQPSGNPDQSFNKKKKTTIIFMVTISFVVILMLFGDYGMDFSMIYFLVMPIIVLVGILMVTSQNKRLAQNNPLNQNNPINQSQPPSQEITVSLDQAFEKINQMVKILIPVLIVVLIVVMIFVFRFLNSSDYHSGSYYIGFFAPIIVILIIMVYLKNGGLKKLKEKMIFDPRLLSGQDSVTQNAPSQPVNPVNRMNNTSASNLPLSKFNTMNIARVDTYAKEDAKIQQQCPFCGKVFYGKRDSCPKCKKII